ncbi:MAG: tetratricopeptide repeat protein [Chloroflexota bacterium]|nr:tetratricopeptide repeat protein [Chloroflexota bacterium]
MRRAETRSLRGLVVLALVSSVLGGCAPTAGQAAPAESAAPSGRVPTPDPSVAARPTVVAGGGPASPSPGVEPGGTGLTPTAQRVAALQAAVAADPTNGDALLELGLALVQRVRETADPSMYGRAQEAFDRARGLRPDDPLPRVGLATLALARHEFADALKLGREALALGPGLPTAQGVVVDALVELGRYEEAETAVQAMVDFRPDLASYARVSYVRELYGDLPGALDAMRRAVLAGGPASENNAYVIVLYGNLAVLSGQPDEAAGAYDAALQAYPDYPAALAGQGRLAVAEGDLVTARARFERAADIVPLPEYVIALGEAREASGDVAGAAESYALARAETALFQANGVVVDLELALLEADHGDPRAALDLAKAAYADRPTVRAADALAWALLKNGRIAEARKRSAEAVRLGSRDPLLLYHAGAIAAAAGDPQGAIRDLRAAVRLDPGFSPTGGQAARALLESLDR